MMMDDNTVRSLMMGPRESTLRGRQVLSTWVYRQDSSLGSIGHTLAVMTVVETAGISAYAFFNKRQKGKWSKYVPPHH